MWQHVKLSDVSLGTRPRYSLVANEDVKKPIKQKTATALTRFSSYLTDRFQSVLTDGNYSSGFNLMYGVPQCSVLGPVLFTKYMLPLANSLKSHNVDYLSYVR